jgi:hypothetical protein
VLSAHIRPTPCHAQAMPGLPCTPLIAGRLSLRGFNTF